MKLKWLGHSCFSLEFADGRTLVTDPFDSTVGYPAPRVRADIVTISHDHFDHNCVKALEYAGVIVCGAEARDLNGVKIAGVPMFHDDAEGEKRGANMMYVIEADGLRIAHLGDLGHLLDEAQLAALANLDLLLIPIGGHFTIDAIQAHAIVAAVKPRLTIAMHYKTPRINFPIADEREFLRLAGGEKYASSEIEVPGKTGVLALKHP